jgi:hypothetical protein
MSLLITWLVVVAVELNDNVALSGELADLQYIVGSW